MKDQIAKLLNKKMNRKDFLKYTAATGLMAVGGGVLLKSAGHLDKLTNGSSSQQVASNAPAGYGASTYGGKLAQ